MYEGIKMFSIFFFRKAQKQRVPRPVHGVPQWVRGRQAGRTTRRQEMLTLRHAKLLQMPVSFAIL